MDELEARRKRKAAQAKPLSTDVEIASHSYLRLIQDSSMVARVQTSMDNNFSRTPNYRHRVNVEPVDIGLERSQRSTRGGILQPAMRPLVGIITSLEFPQYLHDTGLKRERSLELAAASVVAFAGLYEWMKDFNSNKQSAFGREITKSYLAVQRPDVWSNIAFDEHGNQSPFTLMHRCAARVALATCGMDRIYPTEERPFWLCMLRPWLIR